MNFNIFLKLVRDDARYVSRPILYCSVLFYIIFSCVQPNYVSLNIDFFGNLNKNCKHALYCKDIEMSTYDIETLGINCSNKNGS